MYSEGEDTVLGRMIGNVPSTVPATEGSFTYDALSPISQEIAKQEDNLDQILLQVFAQTAVDNGYSDQFESRAREFGLTRRPGTAATVQIQVSGTDGTYTGVVVQTVDGLQYTADVTVSGGTGTVTATAAAIGAAYNVPAGTITEFPVQIAGLTSVTNPTAAAGGTDDETDVGLLGRLLTKVQTPSTSGNANDYKLWALSVPGIGAAKVFPLWNGAGTVKVCVIDENMQPADADLVAAVQAYIESVRPIGATVTYESATALSIDVTVDIVGNSAYLSTKIQSGVTTALANYLENIATKQNYVSYAAIGSLIMSVPGVIDYSGLTVNGGTVNVTVGDEQVAVLGELNLDVTE